MDTLQRCSRLFASQIRGCNIRRPHQSCFASTYCSNCRLPRGSETRTISTSRCPLWLECQSQHPLVDEVLFSLLHERRTICRHPPADARIALLLQSSLVLQTNPLETDKPRRRHGKQHREDTQKCCPSRLCPRALARISSIPRGLRRYSIPYKWLSGRIWCTGQTSLILSQQAWTVLADTSPDRTRYRRRQGPPPPLAPEHILRGIAKAASGCRRCWLEPPPIHFRRQAEETERHRDNVRLLGSPCRATSCLLYIWQLHRQNIAAMRG